MGDADDKKKTLRDEDIQTERPAAKDELLGRRSTMGVIGASVAAITGLMGLSPSVAEAQCSDSDGGRWGDPGGRGRRCSRVVYGGCTDGDAGRWADPGGRSRRCGAGPSVQVRPQGCSDSDGGRWADPGGRGRRCNGVQVQVRRSCSDSDGGQYGDPGGQGRRC